MTTKERKIPWTADEIRANLDEFELDIKFFQYHKEDLTNKYPEQWLAVYRQKIVGHARTLSALTRQLRAKNVPAGKSFIEFATKSPKRTVPG